MLYWHNACERAYRQAMCHWDAERAEENRERYGVDFVDAVTVLEDNRGLSMSCPDEGPPYHVTLGKDATGGLLVVRYKALPDRIELFNARTATEEERQRYEAYQ